MVRPSYPAVSRYAHACLINNDQNRVLKKMICFHLGCLCSAKAAIYQNYLCCLLARCQFCCKPVFRFSIGIETQNVVCCRITFSVKSIVIIRADLIGSFWCSTFHAWTFLQSFYWQLLGQGKFYDFSAGLLSYLGPAFRKMWPVTVTAATLEVYMKSQKLQNQTIHKTISM